MTANAIDLTTAAVLASDLGVTNDATAQRVVTAASRAIANFCGRKFEHATGIVEYPDGLYRPYLLLERAPIVSITSIVECGTTLTAGTDYEAIGANIDAGLVYRIHGLWAFTGSVDGLITSTRIPQGTADSRGIVVTYEGGWVTPGQNALDGAQVVTLPEDVQEACILTAANLYKLRGTDLRISDQRLGDFEVSFFDSGASVGVIPPPACALLAPYIRRGPP